jgi:hypothetical protein
LQNSRPLCACCSEPLAAGADWCAVCGAVAACSGAPDDGAALLGFPDTIRLQPPAGEPEEEPIVRPSLAILFRMAIGPGADHYAPRFLEFERIGHGLPGWNWASLWAPSVWAFYRKLWVAGVAFALWPLLAAAAFGLIEPHLGDSWMMWLVGAALVIWVLPGVVGSLLADTLLYRSARRLVRNAEERTSRPEHAARMLATQRPIAPASAALLGGAGILLALLVAAPTLHSAYADRVVRARVAEVLAAIGPLQQQVADWWGLSTSASIPSGNEVAGSQPRAEYLEAVDVSPANGRVRLTLGPLIPELSGRTILLAPVLDPRQQLRWVCVPVGIPARYLPQECRHR